MTDGPACWEELLEIRAQDPAGIDGALARFAETTVAIRCPANPSWNQQQVFLHLVRLAARLFARLVFQVGDGSEVLGREAAALAKSIQPTIRLDGPATLVIEIGGQDLDAYRVDCSGWRIAAATPGKPLAIFPDRVDHPSTPMLAAAICMGFVTRKILVPASPGTSSVLNTWSNSADDGPIVPKDLDFGRLSIIGLGSIGSTAAGLLAAWGLRGQIDLVDPDLNEARNLRRYPFLINEDRGKHKVDWAGSALQRTKGVIRPHKGKVQDWAHALGPEEKLLLLLVSCDNADGRRAAADAFGQFVVSGTVDRTQAHVFRSNQAWGMCSVCKYMPAGVGLHQENYVMALTGLPQPRAKALTWHESGDMKRVERLTAQDCRIIEIHVGLPPQSLDDWRGKRILGMLAQHQARLYSAMRIPDEPARAHITLPTPSGSAAAGALLVGEACKVAMGITKERFLAYSDIRVDVQSGEITWAASIKDPTGRCLCWDVRRQAWIREIYGED